MPDRDHQLKTSRVRPFVESNRVIYSHLYGDARTCRCWIFNEGQSNE